MSGPSGDTGPDSPEWERHPADVARLVVAAVATATIVVFSRIFTRSIHSVSTQLVRLFQTIPDGVAFALVGIVQASVSIAVIVAVITLAFQRRFRFLAVATVAAAGAGAVTAGLTHFIDADLPAELQRSQVARSWLTGSAYPSAAFLAAAAAVITVSAPFLPRAWYRILTWTLVGVAALRVVTATEVPMNLLLILAVGALIGSLVLVTTGAPHRRVDPDTIASTLRGLGLAVSGVEPGPGRGAPTFRVHHPDLPDSHVALLGRDQRDQDLVIRAWRALRVKGFHARRPVASPRRATEHEQLVLALAGSAGVRAPEPVTIGRTEDEAAVSVTTWVDGVQLARMAPDTVDDATLVELWQDVARLHRRRLAHGWLDTSNVLVSEGRPTLTGWRAASTGAPPKTLAADVAELLCSLAVTVGIERSVASAVAGMDPEPLADALPLLQPLVLSSATRDALKEASIGLGEVREALQQALEVPEVELAPVSRVSIKGIVSLVGSIVLVSYVFTLASDWRDIADAFGIMNWAAVPLLLAIVLVTNSGGALSMMGSVNVDLPFFRTNQIMFAQGFLNRFTPANAGGMALRARYLQREGVDLNVGAAAVGLTSVASGIVQAIFIVVFLVWGGSSDQLSRFQFPSATKVLGIVIVVAAVIGAVVLSAWGRRVVVPKLKQTVGPAISSVVELSRQPLKLAQLFGGAALGKLATIAAFTVCISAMGVDMDFARIGALYMIANTIGSAVPTPGGVGGIEAALTAALISAGVDAPTAGAIVLIFRLFTFWFPTLPGWACLQRAQRTGVV